MKKHQIKILFFGIIFPIILVCQGIKVSLFGLYEEGKASRIKRGLGNVEKMQK
jgi:hypothetical protein